MIWCTGKPKYLGVPLNLPNEIKLRYEYCFYSN